MSRLGSNVQDDELSAIGEAMAAIRSAAPEQRTAFWNGIRDVISDEVFRESPEPREPKPTKAGLVYYLRFGDRVKIGYTTDLRQRMLALPHDELLGTEAGTRADERARHERFAYLRVTGEWFHYDDALREHVATL